MVRTSLRLTLQKSQVGQPDRLIPPKENGFGADGAQARVESFIEGGELL